MTTKHIIYLLLLTLLMGNGFAKKGKLKTTEFTLNGAKYSIVYSWDSRIQSNWNYLEKDTPPVTFKEASALLETEINRVFPNETFQISELNLNTNSAGYAYYHARLTHLINGTDYSYTHLNLEVYMNGNVSKIQMLESVATE